MDSIKTLAEAGHIVIAFVESGKDKQAIITSIARARAAYNGKAGTRVK